jgi:Cys-rich protein (TIGR01571 family)
MADWDTGLFDCLSDVRGCLISSFCAICQISQQRAILGGRVDPEPCDFLLVLALPQCLQIATRGEIRHKYGIRGNIAEDIFVTIFCQWCSIAQQTRQLNMRGDRPGGCFMDKDDVQKFDER